MRILLRFFSHTIISIILLSFCFSGLFLSQNGKDMLLSRTPVTHSDLFNESPLSKWLQPAFMQHKLRDYEVSSDDYLTRHFGNQFPKDNVQTRSDHRYFYIPSTTQTRFVELSAQGKVIHSSLLVHDNTRIKQIRQQLRHTLADFWHIDLTNEEALPDNASAFLYHKQQDKTYTLATKKDGDSYIASMYVGYSTGSQRHAGGFRYPSDQLMMLLQSAREGNMHDIPDTITVTLSNSQARIEVDYPQQGDSAFYLADSQFAKQIEVDAKDHYINMIWYSYCAVFFLLMLCLFTKPFYQPVVKENRKKDSKKISSKKTEKSPKN
jgi:hypothetical protein